MNDLLAVKEGLNKSAFARHSRESGNPASLLSKAYSHWIPAFAGMTAIVQIFLKSDSGLRRNDGK
jgi:hypothetical protein